MLVETWRYVDKQRVTTKYYASKCFREQKPIDSLVCNYSDPIGGSLQNSTVRKCVHCSMFGPRWQGNMEHINLTHLFLVLRSRYHLWIELRSVTVEDMAVLWTSMQKAYPPGNYSNISHHGKRKIIFKMSFLGDILVSWRDIRWILSLKLRFHLLHAQNCDSGNNSILS